MDPDPGAAPIWFDSHCHIQDSFAPDDADAAEVLAAELPGSGAWSASAPTW